MSAEDFISSLFSDFLSSKEIEEMDDSEFADFLKSKTVKEIDDFLDR